MPVLIRIKVVHLRITHSPARRAHSTHWRDLVKSKDNDQNSMRCNGFRPYQKIYCLIWKTLSECNILELVMNQTSRYHVIRNEWRSWVTVRPQNLTKSNLTGCSASKLVFQMWLWLTRRLRQSLKAEICTEWMSID